MSQKISHDVCINNITKNNLKKRTDIFKHSSAVNILDCSIHSLGHSLVTDETFLPLFVSNFTTSKLIISIVPFVDAIISSFPQLLILAKPLKKFKSLKEQIIFFGILERIPWLILGVLILFANKLNSTFILISFFVLYSFHMLCWGCGIPLWFKFIAEIIDEHTKCSFFGTIIILKNFFGFIGGILLSFLLDSFSFPLNFSYTFLLAFIIMSISLLFFSSNKNVATIDHKDCKKSIRELFSVLKKDQEFFFIIISLILSTLVFSIIPFYCLYAKDKYNVLISLGGIFTALFFLGQTIGSIFCSYVEKGKDYKKMMFLSMFFSIITLLIVIFANDLRIYYASLFFIGFALSARRLSFIVYSTRSPSKDNTANYIAIANNLTVPFQIMFPLMSGVIVEYFTYDLLFILGLIFVFLSSLSFYYGSTVLKKKLLKETILN